MLLYRQATSMSRWASAPSRCSSLPVIRMFPVVGFHSWLIVSVSLWLTIPAEDLFPDRMPFGPVAGTRLLLSGRLIATPRFAGTATAGAAVVVAVPSGRVPVGVFAAPAGTASPVRTTAERTRPDRKDRAAAMLRPQHLCSPVSRFAPPSEHRMIISPSGMLRQAIGVNDFPNQQQMSAPALPLYVRYDKPRSVERPARRVRDTARPAERIPGNKLLIVAVRPRCCAASCRNSMVPNRAPCKVLYSFVNKGTGWRQGRRNHPDTPFAVPPKSALDSPDSWRRIKVHH